MGENFRRLKAEGKPPAQRVAIVLSQARRTGRGKCKKELDAAARKRIRAAWKKSGRVSGGRADWNAWQRRVAEGLRQHDMSYEDYSRSFFADQYESGITPRDLVLRMYEESREPHRRRGRAVGYRVEPKEVAALAKMYKPSIQRAKWITALKRAEATAPNAGTRESLREMIVAEKRGTNTRAWNIPPHVVHAIARAEAAHMHGRSVGSSAALTKAQQEMLSDIAAAGSNGLVLDKSIVTAHGLLRKGLVTRIDVEVVPATKLYKERSLTHTVRDRLRFITMSRYTATHAGMRAAGRSAGRIDERHLKADARDIAYIKHEAKDIERAARRLSARDEKASKAKAGCGCKH